MRVIGTAGHVDHGKSTLVRALTGINPDRLLEEQTREMTIDLGFAWMTLSDGQEVGIVDVPGHRDFIENMLAGVGGIDAVLFVIAADEGVMPQTREHLAIIDLLQVPNGIIILTKTDLIHDQEWLDLVEGEVREVMRGTVLENSRIIRVSSRSGEGLLALQEALRELLSNQPARADLDKPRLPVDRVFTLSGFGTVVTGTLQDGVLTVGSEVEILPTGVRGRVRGLQNHKHKVNLAYPGSRTAVNVSGMDVEQINRGNWLVQPGQYRATSRVDVNLRLLAGIKDALRHNTEVKLFIGTSEVIARVRLLGADEIQPGESGWLQLELRHPVVAVRGDRFIIRRPSPAETIGGGEVVDPSPSRRHKRFSSEVLKRLEGYRYGSPAEVLLQTGLTYGIQSIADLIEHSHLEKNLVLELLPSLIASNEMLQLEPGDYHSNASLLICSGATYRSLEQRTLTEIARHHAQYPLRRGLPREEAKSRLKLTAREFNALIRHLIESNAVVESGTLLALPDHQVRFSQAQQASVEQLLTIFASTPYATPSVKESIAIVGEDVLWALIQRGDLIQVSSDVLFIQSDFDYMLESVMHHMRSQGTLTVAEFRDRFGTSRKYALAFLEYLDAQGITFRDGDFRRPR